MVARYKGGVVEKKFLTDTVLHARIKHLKPERLEFKAGQYFTIVIGPGVLRAYSIGSSTEHTNYIDTYVDISPGGVGSKFFEKLEVGETIDYSAPQGRFIYEEGDNPILFVSTGTGIVPFISMIEQSILNNSSRKIKLLQGLRFKGDIYLKEKLDELKSLNPNFEYDFCLSQEVDWEGKKGRVTKFITEEIAKLGPSTLVYACGGKQAVDDVVSLCAQSGLSANNVRFERY